MWQSRNNTELKKRLLAIRLWERKQGLFSSLACFLPYKLGRLGLGADFLPELPKLQASRPSSSSRAVLQAAFLLKLSSEKGPVTKNHWIPHTGALWVSSPLFLLLWNVLGQVLSSSMYVSSSGADSVHAGGLPLELRPPHDWVTEPATPGRDRCGALSPCLTTSRLNQFITNSLHLAKTKINMQHPSLGKAI